MVEKPAVFGMSFGNRYTCSRNMGATNTKLPTMIIRSQRLRANHIMQSDKTSVIQYKHAQTATVTSLPASDSIRIRRSWELDQQRSPQSTHQMNDITGLQKYSMMKQFKLQTRQTEIANDIETTAPVCFTDNTKPIKLHRQKTARHRRPPTSQSNRFVSSRLSMSREASQAIDELRREMANSRVQATETDESETSLTDNINKEDDPQTEPASPELNESNQLKVEEQEDGDSGVGSLESRTLPTCQSVQAKDKSVKGLPKRPQTSHTSLLSQNIYCSPNVFANHMRSRPLLPARISFSQCKAAFSSVTRTRFNSPSLARSNRPELLCTEESGTTSGGRNSSLPTMPSQSQTPRKQRSFSAKPVGSKTRSASTKPKVGDTKFSKEAFSETRRNASIDCDPLPVPDIEPSGFEITPMGYDSRYTALQYDNEATSDTEDERTNIIRAARLKCRHWLTGQLRLPH